jgi:hypothetical protein
MQLTPPLHCLIGGDFNAKHESFKLGVALANSRTELARWATAALMYYISVLGQPTHRAGHVIDLTFSNVLFAKLAVDASMHSRSDYKTIVTSVPAAIVGTPHLDQYHNRVPETSLPKFTRLVEIGVQKILDLLAIQDVAQLD